MCTNTYISLHLRYLCKLRASRIEIELNIVTLFRAQGDVARILSHNVLFVQSIPTIQDGSSSMTFKTHPSGVRCSSTHGPGHIVDAWLAECDVLSERVSWCVTVMWSMYCPESESLSLPLDKGGKFGRGRHRFGDWCTVALILAQGGLKFPRLFFV